MEMSMTDKEEAVEEIKHLSDAISIYSVSYEDVLSKFARAQNVLLQSGATTPLWETHFILVNVLRNKPELSDKVFELSKKYVESRKGTYEADQDLYNFLMRMADADPEHADKVFELTKITTKEDGKYLMSYDLLATFACILRRKPEVAENILDIVEDNHAFDADLLSFSYKLSSLLKETLALRPELADRIFNKLPSYSKTDAYTITQFFNDIVTKNPSLANKALGAFNKIFPSLNYRHADFADACFLISKAVQLKPEAAHKAFDVLANISKKYDNDSLYMGSVHSVLIDIEKASPNLREPCAEMVMNHIHKGVNGRAFYAVLAQACRDKGLKEKLINKYPECTSILQIASKFSHSTMGEIVYALDFINHDKILKDSNISVCQKCLNVMVGQLDKENGGDGSLGRNRKEFLSSELYKNNENWLIAAEYSAATVFGSFFPTYLKKMESANVSVHDAVYFLPLKLSKEDSESLRAFMLKDGNAIRTGNIAERTQQMVPALDALLMNVFFKDNDENNIIVKEDIKKMFSDSLQQNKTKQEFEINLKKYVDENLAVMPYFMPEKFPLAAITKWYDAKIARPSSELALIANRWCNLTQDDRKKSYQDVLKVAKSKKYKDQKYEGFAIEAANSGISAEKYKNIEALYEASFRTPCPFDVTKEFKAGNLTGRFLPRDDPRVGFFGEHTNCCQHLNGIGEPCAVSSMIDAWSQLFVVEKENDNGKKAIVAGSWMWENEVPENNKELNFKFAFLRKKKKSKIYKYACADNIEAIGDYKDNPLINEIYENMAEYLANDCGYRKVTMGCCNQDANVNKYKETDPIPLPDMYANAYTDAHCQLLLAQNKQAPEVDTTQESLRFVRKACPGDFAQMEAVSKKCFPNGDQDLQIPEDDFNGFVLVDKYKGVVGYVLYDKNEKDIYDMAVIPEYREDKNGSSMKLLGEMIKEVKQLGGEWSCEARENTSLRFLKTMQKRGLCDLEIGKIDHVMSDGTKVYKTRFTPKTPQKQNNMIKLKFAERD